MKKKKGRNFLRFDASFIFLSGLKLIYPTEDFIYQSTFEMLKRNKFGSL